ncbi:hypothetical protein B0H13DRAFT_2307536 [Mycena leptocephala]|nr:hypothetical protein B0H13DRAFT_2307536 [Mycena leptocephala]
MLTVRRSFREAAPVPQSPFGRRGDPELDGDTQPARARARARQGGTEAILIINGRPFGFTEVILYVPFAAFLVRASLHSILRPHGLPSTSLPELDPLHAVTGYRGLLVAVFLLPESERESPPTRHSCLPVLSFMVRHRRCSTAYRSSAHLPLAPVPCMISMPHRMWRFIVYYLAGSLLRAVSSTNPA